MKIIDCEQNTDAWHRARMGIPTASEFKTVIGVKKDARDKVTRRNYMLRLAGEILTGEPAETYANNHMERGHAMEDEARNLYCFMHDAEPQRVGFILNGQKGCSPDSLIGKDGVLEIKTALPHILIGYFLKDDFPPEHKAQCQGHLWVTGRDWIDIAVYWPRLPLFVKRAHRDDGYIATLAGAIKAFNEELQEIVETMRRFGAEPARQPENLLLAG